MKISFQALKNNDVSPQPLPATAGKGWGQAHEKLNEKGINPPSPFVN